MRCPPLDPTGSPRRTRTSLNHLPRNLPTLSWSLLALHGGLKVALRQVGVSLAHHNRGMSEQLAHGVDVHSGSKPPASERVPKVMDMQVLDASAAGRVSESVGHAARRPRPPVSPREHVAFCLGAESPEDRHGLGTQGGMLHLPGLRLSQRHHLGPPFHVSPSQVAANKSPRNSTLRGLSPCFTYGGPRRTRTSDHPVMSRRL